MRMNPRLNLNREKVCIEIKMLEPKANYHIIDKKQAATKEEAVIKGRLTERLLAQGLLTPNMLVELQNEWNQVKTN